MRSIDIGKSLDALVSALCADYDRRREIIAGRCASRRVDNELRYLNYKIYSATAEIAGDWQAEVFISDIGRGVGYANSEVDCISEGTYKRHKRLIRENIARKLYLCDT